MENNNRDKKYKVIVFDFDGVIINSVNMSYDLFSEILPDLTMQEFMEMFKMNIFRSLMRKVQEKNINITALEMEQILSERYKMLMDGCLTYDGIGKLAYYLKNNGYILAINSSGLETNINSYLEKVGLSYFFDEVYGAETSKSKIEKFHFIQVRFSVDNKSCLFITDTQGDVDESYKAGIDTVGVTWGLHTRELFDPEKVIGIVDTPAELKTII